MDLYLIFTFSLLLIVFKHCQTLEKSHSSPLERFQNPYGKSMQTFSCRLQFKNAFLTSNYYRCQSRLEGKERMILTGLCFVMGTKDFWYSIPSVRVKPFATNLTLCMLILLWALNLMLKTHLQASVFCIF